MAERSITHLESWIASHPWLSSLRAAREARGPVVAEIRSLSATFLLGEALTGRSERVDLLRGGLWYAVDALQAAHAIFQEDHTPLGSYWHGMMHRREGDFSNACYWFDRASPLPADVLMPGFDPVAFTRQCARDQQNAPELLEVQRQEWRSLMRATLLAALS